MPEEIIAGFRLPSALSGAAGLTAPEIRTALRRARLRSFQSRQQRRSTSPPRQHGWSEADRPWLFASGAATPRAHLREPRPHGQSPDTLAGALASPPPRQPRYRRATTLRSAKAILRAREPPFWSRRIFGVLQIRNSSPRPTELGVSRGCSVSITIMRLGHPMERRR